MMEKNVNKTGFQHLGRPVPGVVFPPFSAGLKWRGADLQTMRNTVLGAAITLEGESQLVTFELPEGRSLAGSLHPSGHKVRKPLIVIIHGLTGSEESPNVLSATAHFRGLGYPVLRLNLRGTGPSAAHSPGPYHAGLTGDLEGVVRQLAERDDGAGIVLYGISLGGNMMLKYLGEQGATAPVRAAIGISAVLDLKQVQCRLMEKRNTLYHNYLLQGLKQTVRKSAHSMGDGWVDKALGARSIYDFDNDFVAPLYGMADAEAYYRLNSAQKFLDRIRVPVLLVHARNDPWVPIDSYEQRDWPAEGPVSLLVTDDGGHAGFHAHDHRVPWQERAAALYLDHILAPGA